MDQGPPRLTKRLRLTGQRFEGGRLPVDSLVEIQSYQEAIRGMADHEWRRDHGGEAPPDSFRDSVSLTIERIEEGSADVFLAFENTAIYQEYQSEARDAVDATVKAAYDGDELPELPTEVQDRVREVIADLGRTLRDRQSIEYYISDDAPPITITVETRRSAVDHLLLSGFLLDGPAPENHSDLRAAETTVVAHVIAVNAEQKTFLFRDAESRTIRGWYRENPDLLDDLRAVVDSESEGPLTRISGQLQYRHGEPWRFRRTYAIERVEFDKTTWGQTLSHLAALPPGWAGGAGVPVSSVALDAAQAVMRHLADVRQPTIGATEDGGVLLEWLSTPGIRSIEILADGTFELFEMGRSDHRGTQSVTADARQAAAFVSRVTE